MRRLQRTTLLLPLLWLAASCGGADGPTPFTIQINSLDVILNAAETIEIVIRPTDLDRRFRTVPDMNYEGGTVYTRVSGAGEFVIRLEREYIQANAQTGVAETAFILEVPVQSSTAPDDGTIGDPTLEVNILRRGERIATDLVPLVWPLPPGERRVVHVECIRPDFDRQCTNNDPLLIDGGS